MTERANKLKNERTKQTNAHLLCFTFITRVSVYPCFVLSDNREEGPHLDSLVELALQVADDGDKKCNYQHYVELVRCPHLT